MLRRLSVQRAQSHAVNKTIQPGPTPSAIRLASQDELPRTGAFFLPAHGNPETFPRSEKIEVATADASYSTSLSLDDGTLVPQDGQTVMAVFDPLKSLGASASARSFPGSERQFKGTGNLWRPWCGCPSEGSALSESRTSNVLFGTNLFLIGAVASDPEFKRSVPVPVGFAQSTLSVPRLTAPCSTLGCGTIPRR
jgi:hypothetical protein